MSYRVFGILRQSIDQGLNPVYPRFSFFLRALYPKESSLRLVEFLQARFKNIEAGFHRCLSLWLLFPVDEPDCASSAQVEYTTSRLSFVFVSPRSSKILPAKRREACGRRIGIRRVATDLQFLHFLLPLLLSPSVDTTRNRPTMNEIDRYRPTTAGDG
ncbi:hypothetical protein GW17_00057749 [Ensete ventricosum]|nr:hypothetical protein GW17_00057749 [Ensete ventricosum]